MKMPLLSRKPAPAPAPEIVPAPQRSAKPVGSPFRGWARVDGDHVLRGWAINRSRPSERAVVQILIDREPVAEILADRFDPKLLELGEGDGRHAFAFVVPARFRDGSPHTYSVRVSGADFQLKQKLDSFEVPAKAKAARIELDAQSRGMAAGRLIGIRLERPTDLELWRDETRLDAIVETQWFGAPEKGAFVFTYAPEIADQPGGLTLAFPGMVEAGAGAAVLVSGSPAKGPVRSMPAAPRRRPLTEADVRLAYELFHDRVTVSPETMAKRVGTDPAQFVSFLVAQPRFKELVVDRLNVGAATLGGALMRLVRADVVAELSAMLALPQMPRLWDVADVPWDQFFRRLLIWPEFLEILTDAARQAVRLRQQGEDRAVRVVGAVDGVFGSEVVGWALDAESPDAPVTVEVLGGRVLLGSAVCDAVRPDVSGAVAEGRPVGFSFDLPVDTARLVGAERFLLSVRDLASKRLIAPPFVVDLSAASSSSMLEEIRGRMDRLAEEVEALSRLLPRFARETSVPLSRYPEAAEGWLTISPGEVAELQAEIQGFVRRPRFSLVVVSEGSDDARLAGTIGSLKAQVYGEWQVVVASRGGDEKGLLNRLTDGFGIASPKAAVVSVEGQAGVAELVNAGFAAADGDFVGVLNAGDRLAPDALQRFAAAAQDAGLALLYADGDEIVEADKGLRHHSPAFRPELDRDLLVQTEYIGFFLIAAGLRARVGDLDGALDGAHMHDFLLRASEAIEDSAVCRCPRVLHHRSPVPPLDSEVAQAVEVRRARAIQAHLDRLGVAAARVRPIGPEDAGFARVDWNLSGDLPPISLIVVSPRAGADLQRCLHAVFEARDEYGGPLQLILALAADTGAEGVQGVETVLRPRADAATLRNAAAEAATGEILIFVDDDLVAIKAGWLRELAAQAMRPEVGAVGAKLIRPDGLVCHAGVVGGARGEPMNDGLGFHAADPGYQRRLALVHGAVGLCGAALAIRAGLFHSLGRFDSQAFGADLADLDLTLRVREAGYRVLCTPHAAFYAFRGDRDGKVAPSPAFVRRWGGMLLADPFYNPNFDRQGLPFSRIRPAP